MKKKTVMAVPAENIIPVDSIHEFRVYSFHDQKLC